jgi:hypothetical protein
MEIHQSKEIIKKTIDLLKDKEQIVQHSLELKDEMLSERLALLILRPINTLELLELISRRQRPPQSKGLWPTVIICRARI